MALMSESQLSVTRGKSKKPIPVIGMEPLPKLISRKSITEAKPNREDKASRVAVAAYYKAQARGFEPGYEMEDWLEAENEDEFGMREY